MPPYAQIFKPAGQYASTSYLIYKLHCGVKCARLLGRMRQTDRIDH